MVRSTIFAPDREKRGREILAERPQKQIWNMKRTVPAAIKATGTVLFG